jgi:hypothetical protein
MKFSSRALLAISVAVVSTGFGTSALWAQKEDPLTPFIGDWKLNPSRCKITDVMKVQSAGGNKYGFDFGGGTSEMIVLDGTDQAGMAGTTLAVTVVAPDAWKVVRKKDGHVLLNGNWKVSQDGSTLSDDYTEFAPGGQVAFHANYLYNRTADGQGFAGTWESPIAMDDSPFVLQIRPHEENGLTFTRSADDSRNLKFDGRDYPDTGKGAAQGSTSATRRVDERTLEINDKINDKTTKTERIEVSADLKTLTRTVHPVGQRGPNIFVFERQ